MAWQAVEESGPVQGRLYKHTKLWAFYADVQESIGTFAETKAAYTAMLELRIITPQLVLNFGAFLEEQKHFEDAFQVGAARRSLTRHQRTSEDIRGHQRTSDDAPIAR